MRPVLLLCCVLASVVVAEEAVSFHEKLPAPVPASLIETQAQVRAVMADMIEERATATRISDAVLKRVFARADKNDDGSLSKQELADFFGEKLTSKVIDLLWDRFDHDSKDGVSEKEFVAEFGKKFAKKEAEKKEERKEEKKEEKKAVADSKPKASNAEKPKDVEGGDGTVKVDFLNAENSEDHHTQKYNQFHVIKGGTDLVLRRGQSFYLTVTASGESAEELEKVVSFSIGGHQVKNVGREGGFRSLTWACKPVGTSTEDQVKFKLWIPADAAVGRHKVEVLVRERATEAGEVIILFNAWSRYDDVHMEDVEQRQEYVLADEGRIWYGDVVNGLDGITGLAWSFHQYEVLNVILDILENLEPQHRGDPRLVSRLLTWMLNSSKNKKGVLTGRWKADFPGGTPPAEWTGSREIFLKYKEQGYKPVKYGQCWVFSGIITTALRSLGIPTRPVTTFRSAHDHRPYDRVIDEEHTSESIWNFHVWADAWMARGDVKHVEPEWNAVDATPQEKSDGKMAMGPAAHHMISGNQEGQYDTEFVIGEVNAVVWLGEKKYKKGMALTDAGDTDFQDVGRAISTLKVGCAPASESPADIAACRHDVTSEYKSKDHPFEEDFRFAVKSHDFQSTLSPARPRMGESFQIRVVRGNIPTNDERVAVLITAEHVLYTGERMGVIKSFEKHCRLSKEADASDSCGNLEEGWSLEVTADDYAPFLSSGGSVQVRVTIRGKDKEGMMLQGNQEKRDDAAPPGYIGYAFERQFALTAPSLTITTVPAVVKRGESFGVVVGFQNPINRPLTLLRATIDTPDYDRHAHFEGPVNAGANVKLHTAQDFKITTAGKARINVALLSQEIHGLYGTVTVDVTE